MRFKFLMAKPAHERAATAFRETGFEEESNAAFRNFCHRSCKIDR